jgi:hypothetical protein
MRVIMLTLGFLAVAVLGLTSLAGVALAVFLIL